MIRIKRGPEPPALTRIRSERLDAAKTAVAKGKSPEVDGYQVAKAELFAMQHRKCCYCEKLEEQAKYRDVEHYRPKARYWWLGWTWENLLFACFECNREHKKDQFPLAPGSTMLRPLQSPPGEEDPLVLDPCDCRVDPLSEIAFRRERLHRKVRWRPYGITDRGWTTIEVCGLDRPTLLDAYVDHVKHVVRPKLEPVLEADRDRDARAVVRRWSTATRALLGPARPFRALSRDALEILLGDARRQQYRLEVVWPDP